MAREFGERLRAAKSRGVGRARPTAASRLATDALLEDFLARLSVGRIAVLGRLVADNRLLTQRNLVVQRHPQIGQLDLEKARNLIQISDLLAGQGL